MSVSQPVRWVFVILGIFAVSAVSILGTLVWVAFQPQYKPVLLTEGLQGAWTDMSREMDRRVKQKFPLGSSVSDMATELRNEGFSRDDWNTSVDGEHKARRAEDQFPCDKAAYVFWRADEKDRLTAIRGEYREEGCL